MILGYLVALPVLLTTLSDGRTISRRVWAACGRRRSRWEQQLLHRVRVRRLAGDRHGRCRGAPVGSVTSCGGSGPSSAIEAGTSMSGSLPRALVSTRTDPVPMKQRGWDRTRRSEGMIQIVGLLAIIGLIAVLVVMRKRDAASTKHCEVAKHSHLSRVSA